MRKTPASFMVRDAALWIRRNRDEWLEIQRVCLALEAKRDRHGRPKHQSITRGGIYTLAQLEGIAMSNTVVFKRDHSLWSVLSRYLVELHPQLKRVIRHRECDVAKYVRNHGLPELEGKYVYRPERAA